MNTIEIEISKIKNINKLKYSFPLERGLYAIVGENGCGKSTFMLALSLIVKTSSSRMLKEHDIAPDSFIDIRIDSDFDHWHYKKGSLTTGKYAQVRKRGAVKPRGTLIASTHLSGFYEGSIFYGCRFDDYNIIDSFMAKSTFSELLVDADSFVSESLGFILHNDKSYYKSLKRIRSRFIAETNNFKGIPYFNEINGKIISQFRMSSGESMLISLIDFINNLVIRNPSYSKRTLFLIDEVELALHPAAIDRLVKFLEDLKQKTIADLVIYFSTHSAELIHRIPAKNIFLIENDKGIVEVVNPCYPNYAVRNLYVPNGFDFLLLVEDELSKVLVERVIRDNSLAKSKLCCVLPAGGCTQILKLHRDMLAYNTLGVGKHIISIYDGDVRDEINEKEDYKTLPKCFIPIPSIEKYLYKKLIIERDKAFIKLINDKYFIRRSLPDIIADYCNDPRTRLKKDQNGKMLYDVIISNLFQLGISELEFIRYLCDDICQVEDMSKFVRTLTQLLS